MLNTIILSITALISAITPIMLAIINKRQASEAVTKADTLQVMHAELMRKVNNQ